MQYELLRCCTFCLVTGTRFSKSGDLLRPKAEDGNPNCVHLSKLKCGFLGDSFLVRLMDSIDLYQKSDGRYNSDVITKLTYNYRSHPQILKVPNNLFYDGELVVSVGPY